MDNLNTFESLMIAPGVRETASEDGAVLLDIEQGICFSLNPVGLKISRLLKRRHTLDQILDTLERDFRAPRSQLLCDLTEFVAELEAKRLIRRPGDNAMKQSWLNKLWPWRKEQAVGN